MARRYKFHKPHTHIVRNPKSGLVTAHVHYPEGHEGLIPDAHYEGAHALGAGTVIRGKDDGGKSASGKSEAKNQVRAARRSDK